MSYHLLANTELTTTAVLTDLNPVPDGQIAIVNNHFLPPKPLMLIWAFALGTNLQRVRITTPKLRVLSPLFVRPMRAALVGGDNPNIAQYWTAPFRFQEEEEITVETLQNAGADQQITVLMALMETMESIPPGETLVIRASSTTAAVANVWSALTYVLDSSLPKGWYAMVGSEHASTNAQGHRWTFDGQFYKPGNPSCATVLQRLPDRYYQYPAGVFGRFRTYNLPRLEVLCNGADNSHEIYLHLVKLAGE